MENSATVINKLKSDPNFQIRKSLHSLEWRKENLLQFVSKGLINYRDCKSGINNFIPPFMNAQSWALMLVLGHILTEFVFIE